MIIIYMMGRIQYLHDHVVNLLNITGHSRGLTAGEIYTILCDLNWNIVKEYYDAENATITYYMLDQIDKLVDRIVDIGSRYTRDEVRKCLLLMIYRILADHLVCRKL